MTSHLTSKEIHIWIIKNTTASGNNPIITTILKKYISDTFTIKKDNNGKPHIVSSSKNDLHISISHTKEVLVLGVSNSLIGIDIEYIQTRTQWKKLSKRYFNEPIQSLHDFYHAWTAREACIKYHGLTLFSALNKIAVKRSLDKTIIEYNKMPYLIQYHTFCSYLIACCYSTDYEGTIKYYYF